MNKAEEKKDGAQTGGIMLLVLMLLIVFITIMSATLRYVIRQSHETVDQEQEEQAFNIADSGVSYVLWLLDPGPTGGQIQPTSVGVINQAVYDNIGNQIGVFTIDNIVAGTGEIAFSSIGRDLVLVDRCQVIEVELRQVESGGQFIVTDWDHQVGYPCP